MEQKIFSDKDKITEILRIFQTNIKDFANKIGVEKQRIYDLTGGNTMYMSREIMQAIAYHCPEISLYWLITGDGQPTKDISNNRNVVVGNNNTNNNNTTDSETIAKLTAIIEQQTRQISKLINTLTD